MDEFLALATLWVTVYAVASFWMLWTERRLLKPHEPKCTRWWTPTHRIDWYQVSLNHRDHEHHRDHQQDQTP